MKSLKNDKSFGPFSTLVQKLFGIQLRTEVECLNCRTKTNRTDISFYLPLSFASAATNDDSNASKVPTTNNLDHVKLKQKESLQTLIDNYFKTEQLSTENGNSYSCANCQSLQNATKKISVTQDDLIEAPSYLILTLNRFIYKTSSATVEHLKIMDPLEYPKHIEIQTWYNDRVIVEKYACIAIVIHSGSSLHYGHYYSYIRNAALSGAFGNTTSMSNGNKNKIEWLLANDSQISETSFEGLISNLDMFKNDTPYVLFYSRCVEPRAESGLIQISSKKMVDIVDKDNKLFEAEERGRLTRKRQNNRTFQSSDFNFSDM